jgi:hypothetical protein
MNKNKTATTTSTSVWDCTFKTILIDPLPMPPNSPQVT